LKQQQNVFTKPQFGLLNYVIFRGEFLLNTPAIIKVTYCCFSKSCWQRFSLGRSSTQLTQYQFALARHFKTEPIESGAFCFGISKNTVFSNALVPSSSALIPMSILYIAMSI
jgi:hypothetical protein